MVYYCVWTFNKFYALIFCNKAANSTWLCFWCCRVVTVELTAVNYDWTFCWVIEIQRPLWCLCDKCTAVDYYATTVLYVDEVVVIFCQAFAYVSVCTAVDNYLTAVSPDCNVVIVVTNAIDCAVTVNCKLTACNNVERTVTVCIVNHVQWVTIDNDCLANTVFYIYVWTAAKAEVNLFVDYKCWVNFNVSHKNDICYFFCRSFKSYKSIFHWWIELVVYWSYCCFKDTKVVCLLEVFIYIK